MGKWQSNEDLRRQETITLDNIGYYDFFVLMEAPNGSSQPMNTLYIERAFQSLHTKILS